MTVQDYKAALEAIFAPLPKGELPTLMQSAIRIAKHEKTVHHALLIAHKLQQEPSKEMRIAADKSDQKECLKLSKRTVNEMFKAMRDQLIKEVNEEFK